MQLHNLISDDGRSLLGKCKRKELEKIATHLNLTFKHGQPADDLRKLIEASGASLDDVKGAIKWQSVQVEDEDGRVRTVDYPEKKPHATAKMEIDYHTLIEQQAQKHSQEVEAKDDKIARLERMVKELADRLGNQDVRKDEHWPNNPELMHINALKRKCRELGIPTSKTEKKTEVLEKVYKYLREENGDATPGG